MTHQDEIEKLAEEALAKASPDAIVIADALRDIADAIWAAVGREE